MKFLYVKPLTKSVVIATRGTIMQASLTVPAEKLMGTDDDEEEVVG